MYKFAVIGAGVVGGLVARELTKYEKSVVILEKENDVAMGQSKANSGIVHAGYDPEPGTLKAELNVKGCNMMESICKDLDVKYSKNGTLVVGYNEEDEQELRKLYQRGLENGVPDMEIIDGESVRKLEKNLSKDIIIGLYAKSAGVVCPYELTIHSIGNAMDNGAELLVNYEVENIKKDAHWTIISKDGRTIEAENIINCAGINSDVIAKLIGDESFKIIPRRGEYILLDKDCGDMVTMTIFRTPSKMGKGVLAVKTVDGNILLGPTSLDIGDKEDKSVTRNGLDSVLEKELEFFDHIPMDKMITEFTGLRAHSDNPDFIINSPVADFINCAGVESPGLTSAPAIALKVAEMLKEMGKLGDERKDFCPTLANRIRFKKMSLEEKNELIKTRPEFGRIVCRCEEVTEGEIVEAIRNNPPARDVDGVKRRTRAGMGRCQGGFCMPIVLEILSRECGMDYDDVTKMGKESRYAFGKTKEGGDLVRPIGGAKNVK